MATSGSGQGTVTITYTVGPRQANPTTTTVPVASPPPQPAVNHQPLPFTGAPVTLELTGSVALLVAGALAALAARRKGSGPSSG